MAERFLGTKRMSLNEHSPWRQKQSANTIMRNGWRPIHALDLKSASASDRATVLRAHPLFKRTRRDRETKLVAGVGNSVGAGRFQVAIGAFGFDHKWCGLALV